MKFRLLAAFSLVLAAAVWFTYRHYASDDAAEDAHFRNEETELIVANLANERWALFRAGADQGAAIRQEVTSGERIWLRPGNYFVASESSGVTVCYPVPCIGYRSGPDEDGAFKVTLRPRVTAGPPLLPRGNAAFSFIPSGSFLLGDRGNPREYHYVWLTGFYVDPFEVTNGEYRVFLDDRNGFRDRSNWSREGAEWLARSASEASATLRPGDPDYERFGRDGLPVTNVTWYEANAYCRWLSNRWARQRWQCSLPTDAEWEKAARGPDGFEYSLGSAISDAQAAAYNWRKNPDAPEPVIDAASTQSRFRANRYGLYHMTGNVAEWAQSVNVPYGREHPFIDDERNHDDTPGLRSVRGGSWYSAATSYLQISYRDSFQPGHRTRDIGFRVVARKLP